MRRERPQIVESRRSVVKQRLSGRATAAAAFRRIAGGASSDDVDGEIFRAPPGLLELQYKESILPIVQRELRFLEHSEHPFQRSLVLGGQVRVAVEDEQRL